ncbi:unnamed protein product [Urochloa humidicola]
MDLIPSCCITIISQVQLCPSGSEEISDMDSPHHACISRKDSALTSRLLQITFIINHWLLLLVVLNFLYVFVTLITQNTLTNIKDHKCILNKIGIMDRKKI